MPTIALNPPQPSPSTPTGHDDNAIALTNALSSGSCSPVRTRLISYNNSPDAQSKREAFQRASYFPRSLLPVKKSTRTGGWANNASRASRTIPNSFEPISSTTGSVSASSSLLPPATIYDLFAIEDEPSHNSPRSASAIVPRAYANGNVNVDANSDANANANLIENG